MSSDKMPLTVRFNLDMVFQRVESLADFNTREAGGRVIPALGKDYFVINDNGILERYSIHPDVDVELLRKYMDEKRLFIFASLAEAQIDPDKMIICTWNDPTDNPEETTDALENLLKSNFLYNDLVN
jgi:hypothetical protein